MLKPKPIFNTALKNCLPVFNYRIVNSSADETDVFIDGAIVDAETQSIFEAWFGDDTSVSFKSFRNELSSSTAKTINVFVNSPGGQVTEAFAIHDFLDTLSDKGITINRIGQGIIASAATLILMSKKGNSWMTENSFLMIHNAGGAISGDVNDIENYAVSTRKVNNKIRDFYADSTGMRPEDITKMMNVETWLTAQEAKDKGFIAKIIGEAKFSNSIKPEQWHFKNKAILNSYNSSVKPEATEDSPTQIFNDMKKFWNEFKAAFTNIKPANATTGITGEEISNAVQKPFEDMLTELETRISNSVTVEKVTETVNTAVTTATANLNTQLTTANSNVTKLQTDLLAADKRITDLTTEITNLKGGKSTVAEGDGTKTIGSFKKVGAA
jgi:ATP-dependent Clp endopeptidase proteolytic subunit ClpP